MRDGQEGEKRRGDRAPERRLRVDRGGDDARGLNGRAYARGPGQTRAKLTTRRTQTQEVSHIRLAARTKRKRTQEWTLDYLWTIGDFSGMLLLDREM